MHWYVGEGMEESEFVEAREHIKLLTRYYEEVLEENGDSDDGSINDEY